jgi:ADP-ribose pyrophosphatase YjhB (NUDIX family)
MMDRACGIIIRNNKLMFIEQKYGNEFFHLFVGGGVEENETPEQAVIRELNEEATVSGEILFGPVTVSGKRRVEHMFIINIADDAEPSPGYDPEFPMDDQDITGVIWLDADIDIKIFTDKDIEYFKLIITDAEKQKVNSEWLIVLKRIVSNYRPE